MNKFFKPYFYIIVGLSFLIIINAFFTDSLIQSIDCLAGIILFICIFSEVMQLSYSTSVSLSLSGPLTIFAVIYKPLIFVYFVIIIYVLAAKIFLKFKSREHDKIFDMKFFFNISQFTILAKLISVFTNLFTIDSSIQSILYLIVLNLIHIILNVILTNTIISLHANSNSFKNLKLKNNLYYTYYYCLISILLIYSYEAYNIVGLVLTLLFILPLQSTILNQTSSHELNQKLITDKMTGAFNRHFLEESLKEKLIQTSCFTILFLDLDSFKEVNDIYGHVVGDSVLKDFVKQLKKHLCREDKIFRYGGDEFCILVNDKNNTASLINRLKNRNLTYVEEISDTVIEYSFSVGSFDYNGEPNFSFNDLIEVVDKKMYVAKKEKTSAIDVK